MILLKTIAVAILILLAVSPLNLVHAQNKVVVVPLIGNDSELKPIRVTDLIEQRGVFTTTSDRLTIGTVSNARGIIITSITVAPENYPATLAPISLRFCRDGGSCTHNYRVPNNTISTINYGLGDIMAGNGEHYIDMPSRGGLPQNVLNQIVVHVSGYYFNN